MEDIVKFYPKPDKSSPTLHNKDVPVNKAHLNARRFIIVRTSLVLYAVRGIIQWLFGYRY